MKPFFFNLKYVNALEVVGFFIKEGVPCEVIPIDRERANIHFQSQESGERAKRHFYFLKNVPIRNA